MMVEEPELRTKTTLSSHLATYGQSIKNKFSVRKAFADFAGVTIHPTTTHWFSGEHEPGGTTGLRVRMALEALGYYFPEHKDIPRPIHLLAQCVAFDVATPADAERLMRVADRSAIRILMGRVQTTTKHHDDITAFVASKHDELVAAINRIRDLLAPDGVVLPKPPHPVAMPPVALPPVALPPVPQPRMVPQQQAVPQPTKPVDNVLIGVTTNLTRTLWQVLIHLNRDKVAASQIKEAVGLKELLDLRDELDRFIR